MTGDKPPAEPADMTRGYGMEVPHLTDRQMLDYWSGALPTELERAADEHVAACDRCAGRVRRAAALLRALGNWTAAAAGQDRAAGRVAAALAAAERAACDQPEQLGRLVHWRREMEGRAEAALRVTIGDAARFIIEGLDAVVRPGTEMQLAYAAPHIRTRGPARQRVVIKSAGVEVGCVVATGSTITVELHRGCGSGRRPLVLLIPQKSPETPQIREPGETPTGVCAEFRDVPPGRYLVLIEPAR
jgi:hypothetical protein